MYWDLVCGIYDLCGGIVGGDIERGMEALGEILYKMAMYRLDSIT